MDPFNNDDLVELERREISLHEAGRQLEQYRNPPGFAQVLRPCTAGDGILQLSETDLPRLAQLHDGAAQAGRITKFVPASGAATRMFKDLFPCLHGEGCDGEELGKFIGGLSRFAFYQDLLEELSYGGSSLESLLESGNYRPIVQALLSEDGLRYADLPKGLLPFHRYDTGSRTAFEEHVMEAASYTRDSHGVCRMHFTVSPEHLTGFTSHFRDVGLLYMNRFTAQFDMGCSNQKPSTDTLAVTPHNLPFRASDGNLLFRPGGHGALIENLDDLKADIVFIKNIDNVQPERLLPVVTLWKKALGGCLLELQQELFRLEERVEKNEAGSVEEAARIIAERFGIQVAPSNERVLERLRRPLRVCGVVKNTGEPGGGPFWVDGPGGGPSLQIVETAQIDPDSPEQQAHLAAATHFNPVDLVCGVRDRNEKSYDLLQFVDPGASLIASKTAEGKPVKVLERPGLWNGAMAGWNTVFVEVPLATFSPVKSVNDLLRPEHQ